MIIRRYIIKETLKSQLAILFILFMIFFSQKLIRILSSAIDGDIPNDLVMSILLFGISDIADLIIPLSLFLGILVAFGRFYNDSEMVAMYACGVKKSMLYQVVTFLSIISCIFTIINSVWYGPWSSVQEEYIMKNAKLNPSIAGMLAGQFQPISQGNSVIYIGQVDKNGLNEVFIAQTNNLTTQRPAIITADKGKIIQDSAGNQLIQLDHANRYEGIAELQDFRISNFENYQAIIKPKEVTVNRDTSGDKVDQLTFKELKKVATPKAKAEYYWRISLILSVPLMAFLVIPLSAANPRQGKLNKLLPAILLYLVYFLLESSIRANASKGKLDPTTWFYIVNGIYLLLAIFLNIWNTTPIKKLRYKFFSKRLA
ncbi:LPS export ABC transporter permease LptF [Orbaceae bacterium ac157xtp]